VSDRSALQPKYIFTTSQVLYLLGGCPVEREALVVPFAILGLTSVVDSIHSTTLKTRAFLSIYQRQPTPPYTSTYIIMWGDWVEKAKQAAAVIDQQLNESVGAEVVAAKKNPSGLLTSTGSSSGGTGGSSDAPNVWNDDDYKFDDDEDATAPPPAIVEEATSAVASVPSATNNELAISVLAKKDDDSMVAKAKVDEPEEEEVNPDFDSFDGLKPSHMVVVEQHDDEEQITPPKHEILGGFPSVKLGALGGFGKRLLGENIITAPKNSTDINFMSPFSSLMTSINNDQQQKHTEAEDEEEILAQNNIDLVTPSNETEPTAIKETFFTPAEQASGAWQDEEIDFGGEDTEIIAEQNILVAESSKEDLMSQVVTEEKTSEPSSLRKEEKKQEEVVTEQIKEPTVSAVESSVEAPSLQSQLPLKSEVPQQLTMVQPAATMSNESKATGVESSGPVVSSVELEEVKKLLAQREEQLAAKAEQMFQLQQMYEKEKSDLVKKVTDTKEEAKKRIMKARERCEQAEKQLQASTSALSEDAAQQAEIVSALREEGQKLAMKQSEMEKSVRVARGEARELKEQLEDEMARKADALQKIEKLQADLKSTQEQLASARKGETQAGKLEKGLEVLKEDVANKANTIMALEQTVKELKAENKDLTTQVEASLTGAALENQKQAKNLRKEHNAAIADLENKLQVSEREAAVREDSLRREVEELRKRWQDAVRRADGKCPIIPPTLFLCR
jgi:hypothetical protein